MADFTATQTQLAAARASQDAAQLAALQATAKARQARAAVDLATRRNSPTGRERQPLAQLTAAAEQAAAEQSAATQALQNARASVSRATASFGDFSNPKDNLSRLSDSSPLLLFPVRIETRFRKAGRQVPQNPGLAAAVAPGPQHELLVRIYPDDCSIDTFEPMLSQSELANIKSYWVSFWRAGDVESNRRAAWRKLVDAHGAGRAGWLADNFQPLNLSSAPHTANEDTPVFPPDPVTTEHSWAQAPQVRQFPDRFAVVGFNGTTQTLEAVGSPVTLPLYTGPDPAADLKADPTSGIHPDGPDLFVPDPLQWMVDFGRAVEAGMALAIPLTAQQYAAGFTRLLVVGVRLSTPASEGPAALQELLAHHQWSRSGFSLIPQGTPTHNSSGAKAGATTEDDPDASFDDRVNRPLFTVVTDPAEKKDGQWLAEFLRLDPAFVAGVHGSDGSDQMHARAMQTALWPATLGYWMDTLFTPNPGPTSIFPDSIIESTRSFFTSYVSGRGPLPALRIGGQPYGILPVTAFSRIQWLRDSPRSGLYNLLRQLDADWSTMAQNAAWVGKGGDPHQNLLDIVGLTPSSIEYYSRNAESLSQLFNILNRFALGPVWLTAMNAANLQTEAVALLNRLGYTGTALPDLLNHYFLAANPRITTLIDDRPLSETEPVRAYTPDNRNYIQWLIDAASLSLDALREESGFSNDQSPQALLYLLLRHALLLGYYGSSYNFHRSAGFLSPAELLAMRTEPTFVHVAEAPGTTESRFGALYKTESRITGNPTLRVSDYISQRLFVAPESSNLHAQITALQALVQAPTAALERAFAEHIDTCSYRYDAWLLGLVNERVQTQLASAAANKQRGGLYLGAYAWVEELHPSTDPLVPAQLPPDIAKEFADTSPLMSDGGNGGYIHAPSLPHANAASVLRAAFVANGADSGELAVNLSSDRVRVALALIEGIRNGQSLGALLGYQFEKGLHDRHGLAEVDKFVFPLRKQFPLAADALASTQTGPDVPIEAIEARNVVDGKKLVDQILKSNTTVYPWGVTTLPSVASPAEQTALNAEAEALRNSYDAVADLALAEGVYQAVQGNYDRVASTIAAYTTGHFPPEPGIVDTSPPGTGLTHRFGIHFKAGLTAPAGATPRAQAEPAVDDWLRTMLPPLDQIACTVSWSDPITSTVTRHTVTLADLGLHPIDALYLLKPDNAPAMAEIDDRIQRHVASTWSPRPDAGLKIEYMTAPTGLFSVFESGPLLRSLRSLLAQSRPLRASDVLRANDARTADDSAVFVDSNRLTQPLATLTALAGDLDTFINTTLAPLLSDTVANRAQIIAQVDGFLTQAMELLERAARLALPSSGWGFILLWRQSVFTDLLAQVGDLITRWSKKLTDFANALNAYDLLPASTSDADRFRALQAAELIVSAQVGPLPATPAQLRMTLPAKGTALQNRLGQFQNIRANPGSSFSSLLAGTSALSTAEFDAQPFGLSGFGDEAITITQDISRTLTSQLATATARITAVNKLLTAATSAGSARDKVVSLTAAAKALFGDDFQIIPEFKLAAAQGAEWVNALNASGSGELFKYLKTTLKIDFPADEWFHGAARVREPLRHWETALMLATAFDLTPPALTPIQLPFAVGDSWLALEYPPDYTLDSDRLLYTALYSQPFDPANRQCGVLIDEWTEVIPGTQRDTGITFNYARPDNEPPQSILLVVPASTTGSWQWADLIGALNETLDLAKKRAVEPAFLDPTAYSRFLPATVTATTSYGITIGTALTAANGVMQVLQGAPRA